MTLAAGDTMIVLTGRMTRLLCTVEQADPTPCKGCGAPMVWVRTPAGKMMPVDPPKEADEPTVSHHATCPEARRFRRRKAAVGMKAGLVLLGLVAAAVTGVLASPAQAATSVDYRTWCWGTSGPRGSCSQGAELVWMSRTAPVGLRVVGAWGAYQDSWDARPFDSRLQALDVTWRLTPRARVYVGAYRVTHEQTDDRTEHTGWRVGLMGTIPLRGRWSLAWDAAVPFNTFTVWRPDILAADPSSAGLWSSRGLGGHQVRVGVRYTADAWRIEGGVQEWKFLLPVPGGDHTWSGPYLSVGVSR